MLAICNTRSTNIWSLPLQELSGDKQIRCWKSGVPDWIAFITVPVDHDDAEKLLLEAVKGRHLKLGDTHPHTLESWQNLIELFEAWDKPEQAEEWRAKLTETEAVEQ